MLGKEQQQQQVVGGGGGGDTVRVLLYGYYNDIYVIDASSLVHLYTLSSKTSPDWISAVTVARPLIGAGKYTNILFLFNLRFIFEMLYYTLIRIRF